MGEYKVEMFLLETEEGGRKSAIESGYRPHLRINDNYYDFAVELIEKEKLFPGEKTQAYITFLFPQYVFNLPLEGNIYNICEGKKIVGNLKIIENLWKYFQTKYVVGQIIEGEVKHIGWTCATVLIEPGLYGFIKSEDFGLKPWAEIGSVVKQGLKLKLKIKSIDSKDYRFYLALDN